MHTMTKRQGKSGTIDVKALLAGDEEFLRALMRTALEEVLEVEMTEALVAEKSERTTGRLGYRSGYYGRTLVTRIGKLELRVPQDRGGRFAASDTKASVAFGKRRPALMLHLASSRPNRLGSASSQEAPSSPWKAMFLSTLSRSWMGPIVIGPISGIKSGCT